MTPSTRSYQSLLALAAIIIILLPSCHSPEIKVEKEDQVATNIKMYSNVWDQIINKGNTALFNDSNFVKDVRFKMKPADVVGIDSAMAYYNNFLVGFSERQFTIKDIFGQGDKLVKYWNFKGKHTGEFFGIPATGKMVDLDGATIVLMRDGKIAQEQDFVDNMDLMTQLGLMPEPGK
jgi:steroid delta-isomerase-like uncharacterized protein